MVKRTDQYLRESDPTKKSELTDKLLKIHDKEDNIQREYNAFVDVLSDVQAISSKPKQLNEHLSVFLETLHERQPDEIRALIRDVVSRIEVGPKCVDIVFKHPYVSSKEVLTDVAT